MVPVEVTFPSAAASPGRSATSPAQQGGASEREMHERREAAELRELLLNGEARSPDNNMYMYSPLSAAPSSAPAPAPAPSRKRKPSAETCWGQELAGGGTHAKAEPLSAAFRQRFCAACQRDGLLIPASRVRVHNPLESAAPSNQHGGGVWNTAEGGAPSPPWPAHRVVNQTAGCVGPKLVLLRDPTTATIPGLLAVPCAPGSVIAFRVGRTLQPTALPPLLLKSLPPLTSDPPLPPLPPQPLESSGLPPQPPPLAPPSFQASSSPFPQHDRCLLHALGSAVQIRATIPVQCTRRAHILPAIPG